MEVKDLKLNGYELYNYRDVWQINWLNSSWLSKRLYDTQASVGKVVCIHWISPELLEEYINSHIGDKAEDI